MSDLGLASPEQPSLYKGYAGTDFEAQIGSIASTTLGKTEDEG